MFMETWSFFNGVEQVIDRRETGMVWSGAEKKRKEETFFFSFFFCNIIELNKCKNVQLIHFTGLSFPSAMHVTFQSPNNGQYL